jgi:hypothetical protein
MTNQVQLHVGYVGITREGKRVEITKETGGAMYPYSEESGRCYKSGGAWCSKDIPGAYDIVGPWVETPVEPPVDYNDGKWHRWAGGECPVHLDSVVEVMFIDGQEDILMEEAPANMWTWDSNNEPITTFRVTEEYVETPKAPLEFWVIPSSHIVREAKYYGMEDWFTVGIKPHWFSDVIYRIKPEPVVVHHEMHSGDHEGEIYGFSGGKCLDSTYVLTFDTEDGVPVCSSVKLSKLT